MLRKRIVKVLPSLSVPEPGDMDIAATAAVQVTSEDPVHPVEHVFDHRRGPGEQTLLLAFDTPQTIHQIIVEVEELEVSRTQKLRLSVSRDGGQSYRELQRQEYNFIELGADSMKGKI